MSNTQKPRRNTTYNRNKAIITRHHNGQSVTQIATALNLSPQVPINTPHTNQDARNRPFVRESHTEHSDAPTVCQ